MRVIEEEGKNIIREQELIIEQVEQRVNKERQERDRMRQMFEW